MLNFKKINEVAASLLEKAPGFAVSIFTDSEVLFQLGFGVTNTEEQGIDITPVTLFRIGSVSKTLTATLIMKLVEQGLLDLDCPVKEYIPEFRLSYPRAEDTITLRMLLSHTAGLPDGGDLFGSSESDALEKYVREEISKLPFVAPPNTMYSYSNHSINLAAYTAEKAAGKRFAQLMNDEIFTPLEMSRTMYDPLKAMTYPLALQHEKSDDGSFKVEHSFPENAACHGSFFCISNAADMTKFGQMYLSNGKHNGKEVLSQESFQEIFKMQANRYTIPESSIGLCWIKDFDKGINYWWHSGGIGTYRSFIVLFPEHNIGIFTAANNNAGWEIVEEVINQFGSKNDENKFEHKTDWKKVRFAYGNYLSVKSGLLSIPFNKDPSIFHNGRKLLVQSLKDDHIVGVDDNGEVVVSIGLINHPDYLMVNGSPSKKIMEPLTKLNSDILSTYFGDYQQGEMVYTFFLDGDNPFFFDGDDKLPCTYLFENKFFCPGYGLLEFEEDVLKIQNAWAFEKQK
ncbi:serine hydrolase domain-containing protein [Neobacillus drentensis]|uniref:serine hydrolase domain-containing protein n=1 Tax=Neobacillus drentensis TaxID=220684 RepID=UPI002FFE2496